MKFDSGNAFEDGKDFGEWFVGDFSKWSLKSNAPNWPRALRHSRTIEVKYATHETGPRPGGFASTRPERSICILLSGKIQFEFRQPNSEVELGIALLAEAGDYVIFEGGIDHLWTAYEKTIILTVRWNENLSHEGNAGNM
ncbi:MAG: hypothetical protein HY286_00325 [Planctomycetes bacterium]|nr:hypothetical protein [Planctomycetota bacterium]